MINLQVNEGDIKLEREGDVKTLLSEMTYAINTLIDDITTDFDQKEVLLEMMIGSLFAIKDGVL